VCAVTHGTRGLPVERDEKHSLPTNVRMSLLLAMAVIPEERAAFRKRFLNASNEMRKPTGGEIVPNVCGIPISWIGKAYECEPVQLHLASDMFPMSRMQSEYLNDFYILDVILNRRPSPLPGDSLDPEVVRPFLSYEPGDEGEEKDYLFRAAILFLPQCGVFYCHRDRRRGDVGVSNTFIAHDMSWLRLQRDVIPLEGEATEVVYTFGSDSYIKKSFHDWTLPTGTNCEHNARHANEQHSISAWRISTGRTHWSQQKRVLYRAVQCCDTDRPMLAPDLIGGEELVVPPGVGRWSVPQEYLAAQYQHGLATSTSAKLGGRWYVREALHYQLPDTCWIIDPEVTHNVDLMVDLDTPTGETGYRQSVVLIRNANEMNKFVGDNLVRSLDVITQHNKCLRERAKKGTPRTKCGDLGTMHAIGTRVALDKITVLAYEATEKVPRELLRSMVVGLANVGRNCFPQVYAVIRDTEGNCGVRPVPPMNGEVVDNLKGCTVGFDDNGDLPVGRRVGFSIDQSDGLGNASHKDVHDASQGYSTWTEEIRKLGANWYFILPNVHGVRPDPNDPDNPQKSRNFYGLAVRLTHGVAISWDGRKIRHCTSVSKPDGVGGKRIGERCHFNNHLYGTFTAAKERIVQAGRALCASNYVPPSNGDSEEAPKGKKKHRKQKRKSRSMTTDTVQGEVSNNSPASGNHMMVAMEPVVVAAQDLEPGGRYTIPKKTRKLM
jgi:hypothetical protein